MPVQRDNKGRLKPGSVLNPIEVKMLHRTEAHLLKLLRDQIDDDTWRAIVKTALDDRPPCQRLSC